MELQVPLTHTPRVGCMAGPSSSSRVCILLPPRRASPSICPFRLLQSTSQPPTRRAPRLVTLTDLCPSRISPPDRSSFESDTTALLFKTNPPGPTANQRLIGPSSISPPPQTLTTSHACLNSSLRTDCDHPLSFARFYINNPDSTCSACLPLPCPSTKPSSRADYGRACRPLRNHPRSDHPIEIVTCLQLSKSRLEA